jgi:hypothetical protein
MSVETRTTVVDEARVAYQRQRAEREADERIAAEKDRAREALHTIDTLRAVLGLEVAADEVEVVGGVGGHLAGRVIVEGGLVLERASGQYLRVMWACSSCGRAVVPSPTFRDLAGLGWILEEGVRDTEGRRTACFACDRKRVLEARAAEAAAAPAPTAEEQLVEALRRFVVSLHDGDEA